MIRESIIIIIINRLGQLVTEASQGHWRWVNQTDH